MKALIVRDSYAPCYYLDLGDVVGSVEVPEELEKEYELVLRDFDNLQGKLAQLYWSTK
jgi:hypothetical protein